jgi:hypothetical protein
MTGSNERARPNDGSQTSASQLGVAKIVPRCEVLDYEAMQRSVARSASLAGTGSACAVGRPDLSFTLPRR